MNDRETILTRVRLATASRETRAPYPDYSLDDFTASGRLESDLWSDFEKNLENVHGCFLNDTEKLTSFLSDQCKNGVSGYCDPALMNSVGQALAGADYDVSCLWDSSHVDDYEFAVTRATLAVAESGTVVLDDCLTCHRMAALAPWVHIAVVETDDIVASLGEAVERFGEASNIVWVTGPSKTADIEGVLIEGVHGPGVQGVLRLPV